MQKGIAPIYILVGTLVLLILVGGSYLLGKQSSTTTPPAEDKKACTLEAKICPDGSGVGRVGPKCEFAQCPVEAKITKEQAIECVQKEATKIYPNEQFTVMITDENEDTYYTEVTHIMPPYGLMGWFPVNKTTCETHLAKP